MKKYVILVFLASFTCGQQVKTENAVLQKPVIDGEFVHIFNPNDTRSKGDDDQVWYTNDHCFAMDSSGIWHAYGIIGRRPADAWNETQFFHASSRELLKPQWDDHGYAMTAEPGVERVLWAPHIYQENGVSYMFYNTGNMQENARKYCSWGQLRMAHSRDMFQWTRHDRNPLFSDPGHARDACVKKFGDLYYFYYTRTFSEVDTRSCVGVRTSHNLLDWSGPKIAHIQPNDANWWGGDAESPMVIFKNGYYYLFICLAMTEYNLTKVYWSNDPLEFPIENLVTSLPVHAAEIIHDEANDQWYISATGWDKKGLFLAKLKWELIQ